MEKSAIVKAIVATLENEKQGVVSSELTGHYFSAVDVAFPCEKADEAAEVFRLIVVKLLPKNCKKKNSPKSHQS